MDDAATRTVRYRVTGMDCAADAAEIERAAGGVPGVASVKVSTASQVMTLRLSDSGTQLSAVEHAVAALGYRVERMGTGADRGHVAAGYRRALWIVVVLNAGFGAVEMVGGFVSGSQAVKADALDFLGDGLITFLGLLAIGWSPGWRARAALVQGLFLAAMALGVVVSTVYRVLVQQRPEAELMGLLGVVALAVNVACAAVLVPHRAGDANVRAVWLFSRNDAIGNVAVVAAAGLVAWTRSAWPDLAVAGVVALLFLQSSSVIVRDARSDLRERGV
jgi:Co/Zn/Cd efflux system component/copper chaperone CopZ